MVNITIDNRVIEVEDNTTIMEAAKRVNITIPHLCYLKDLNEIGACRVCVVELSGKEKLVTACNTNVQEGMVIHTNSPKVRETRKTVVQLILSQHDCECAYCSRSGNCSLQTVANDLGITSLPFEKDVTYRAWNQKFPLIRESNKCIKCMRCIQVCDKVQDLHVWDVESTGSRTNVNVSCNRRIEEADCSLCGQCITHCPVNALHARDDTQIVFDALKDPDKITIVQMAPAVRAAWGEQMGLTHEEATVERMAAALRKIGIDYVFDTNYGADLTIMEEASEFLERYSNKEKHTMPMFTSCCPGWVRFVKSQYPDMLDQVSTCKSPHQMFGAITKTYYAGILGVDPERIFNISIMPCVAKKHESEIPVMNDSGFRDVDVVITTREMVRILRAEHIDLKTLQDEPLDNPLGESTGAAVIFGVTGGVMEAALRTAYYFVTKKNPPENAFKTVRGMHGWKEAEFSIEGNVVKTATVHGLGNTRKLIEAVRKGEVSYDFIEVMACPGGCVGGGGQPIFDGEEKAEERARILYELDDGCQLRNSHENKSIQTLYKDFLGNPLSEKSEELLHTDHEAWSMPPKKATGSFLHSK